MAFLTGPLLTEAQDLYTATTVQLHDIGQRAYINGGRIARYVKNGTSALITGNLLQESAENTTYENMAVGTAGVAGDNFIQVTNGTATITSELFTNGTIGINTAGTAVVGDEYDIVKITGTFTTGGALKVFLDRPLRTAITTSATVNMKRNPWSSVVQFPVTTQTGMPVGIAMFAIPASTSTVFQYGWVISHGECTALSDNSTFAVGSQLSPSLAVAGAVGVNVAGTTHGNIGWARMAKQSAAGIPIFLQID